MSKVIRFSIQGMHCATCEKEIQTHLLRLDFVEAAEVSFATSTAKVTLSSEENNTKKKLSHAIKELGYLACFEEKSMEQKDGLSLPLMIVAVLFAAPLIVPMIAALFQVNFKINGYLQLLLASVVQFGCGYRFYQGSYNSIKNRSLNMDVLVSLGTTAAYGFSLYLLLMHQTHELYFETSSVLIALILVGRHLEERSKRSAQKGMRSLLKMQPKVAIRKEGSTFTQVEINEVKKGDILLIKPGSCIPVDGVVVKGSSSVDESMLSGESVPSIKQESSKVYTGSVNQEGSLEISAEKFGEETALGKMIALVEEAASSKAPVQKMVDRVSSWFVPCVLVVCALTFAIWMIFTNQLERSILSAVATLVIACPCALGLATPTVIMVAIAKGAKAGVLMKSAEAFELTKNIKAIVVDKTGTVTEGKLELDQIHAKDAHEFLTLAASLSQYSNHPVAHALLKKAKEENVQLQPGESFNSVPGKGVVANLLGDTYYLGSKKYLQEVGVSFGEFEKEFEKQTQMVTFLAAKDRVLGFCTYKDPIKPQSKESVMKLQDLGLKLYMLSGDLEKSVEKVAKELQFDAYKAEALPEEKAEYVKRLQKEGLRVGMVGDGVNDAPALASADVGFAVGSGTDVAMESAMVGLMRSNLENLYQAIRLSKMTSWKVKENLCFALVYNVAAIPIAAFGLLSPMIAGLAMALSSICVVLNALTLKLKKL